MPTNVWVVRDSNPPEPLLILYGDSRSQPQEQPKLTTSTNRSNNPNKKQHQTTTALLSVFYDLNGLSNRIRRRGVRTKGKTATRIDKMLIFLLVFAAYVYVFLYCQ